VLLSELRVDANQFTERTGWELKPQGACKGEACVPLPPDAVSGGTVDMAAVADRLGMPVVHDEAEGLWAVGPETGVTGRALTTAHAPELELPDLRTGDPFRLSSLRGQKVILLAWASW
jgi:hypothetical protein